jgi:hypothetical protein
MILRALMSEWRLGPDEWPCLVPIIMMAINITPSARLGGKSPWEFRFGRAPPHPLDVILTPTLAGVVSEQVEVSYVLEQAKQLQASIEGMHRDVVPDEERSHVKDKLHTQYVNWELGDFVLVARVSKAARNKLVANWRGPMKVVDTVNEWVYRVKDIITGHEMVVHAERLRYYSDAMLSITQPLKEIMAHDGAGFIVKQFGGVRYHSGEWQVLVHWLGFEDDEASWEPFMKVYQDVPKKVASYLRKGKLRRVDREALEELVAAAVLDGGGHESS